MAITKQFQAHTELKAEDLNELIAQTNDSLGALSRVLNGGSASPTDITAQANFQALGYWISNNGSVVSSTNHSISDTILFHAGDHIKFTCRTASGNNQYMMFISPTADNVSVDDTRTFTAVGLQIKNTDGEQELEYEVQEDCYMVFQSNKNYSETLIYTSESTKGLVKKVEEQNTEIDSLINIVGDSSSGLVKEVSEVTTEVSGITTELSGKQSIRPSYIFEGAHPFSNRYKNGGFPFFIIDAYFDIYATKERFYFIYSDNNLASLKLCSKLKADNSGYTTHLTLSNMSIVAESGYTKYSVGNSYIIVNPNALSVTQYNSTTYSEGVALNPALFKGKPAQGTNAENVSYGSSNVKSELDSINEELYGSGGPVEPIDVTAQANFQALGYWINDYGSVVSSANHSISDTILFHAGDHIKFTCRTANSTSKYMMFISPTADNVSVDDTRTFTAVGLQIKNTDGEKELEYEVQEDCYMVFQSNKNYSETLIYTPASSSSGLVEEVEQIKEQVEGVEDVTETVISLNEQINGSTPVVTTNIGNTYTAFRNDNGGKAVVTITTIASGDHPVLGVYLKVSPNDSTYIRIADIDNQVNAKVEIDLSGSTYDNYFYIKNDLGAKMTVEWKKGEGLIKEVESIAVKDEPVFMPFNNIALPKNPSSYKILVIGNSFSQSMYGYILQLCNAAGIQGLTFGRTYAGGTTLENQYTSILNKTANREFWVSENGAAFVETENATIEYALNYTDWDMIMVHEKSERSGLIKYYNEWLPKLVGLIRSYKTTRKAKIVMQLTWAMSENSTYDYLDVYYKGSQEYMFNCLCSVYQKLLRKFGMDVVVPNHLSIQNARTDSTIMAFTDIGDLTGSDGLHLNDYGRYIQSATFFESIIAPMFGKTIWDNTYKFSQALTDNDMLRLKACAVLACGYSSLQGTGNAIAIDSYISTNS